MHRRSNLKNSDWQQQHICSLSSVAIMAAVLVFVNTGIDTQCNIVVGTYGYVVKPVLVMIGWVLLGTTIVHLLQWSIAMLDVWMPNNFSHYMNSNVGIIIVSIAIARLFRSIIRANNSGNVTNRHFIAFEIFCKLTEKCAVVTVFVVCGMRFVDLIDFLIINHRWSVHLMCVCTTLAFYKLPRTPVMVEKYIYIFTAQYFLLDIVNRELQTLASHINWMTFHVYCHPPLALPVVYDVQVIWLVFEFFYILASSVPYLAFPLRILIALLPMPILVLFSKLLIRRTELSWIGTEFRFILLVLAIFTKISCVNGSTEQTPTRIKTKDVRIGI